jgi:hypothetical protein
MHNGKPLPDVLVFVFGGTVLLILIVVCWKSRGIVVLYRDWVKQRAFNVQHAQEVNMAAINANRQSKFDYMGSKGGQCCQAARDWWLNRQEPRVQPKWHLDEEKANPAIAKANAQALQLSIQFQWHQIVRAADCMSVCGGGCGGEGESKRIVPMPESVCADRLHRACAAARGAPHAQFAERSATTSSTALSATVSIASRSRRCAPHPLPLPPLENIRVASPWCRCFVALEPNPNN